VSRFYDLNVESRLGVDGQAGDLAESKVREVCAAMDRPLVDFGPKRVALERGQQTTWTPIIRHAPDYLGWGRFIEVQGSDGRHIIFKESKLSALTYWDAIMPVFLGIYLQSRDEVLFCDLPTVTWAIAHDDSEELILDADTRAPKTAWKVPVSVLEERLTVDCFAAAKAEKKVKKS
jgi:hypothetical protein